MIIIVLVVLALVLAILSAFPTPLGHAPLLAISVILLAVAMLIPGVSAFH